MSVHFDEARKTWYAQVKIRDLASGEVKPFKKRGFRLKREALAWEVSKRKDAPRIDGSFINAMSLYLDTLPSSSQTKDLKLKRIKKYFPPHDMPVSAITRTELLKFQLSLKDSGLSYRTKNAVISYVKAVYKFAHSMYDVRDISGVLTRFPAPSYVKEINVWTIEEFNLFLAAEKHPVFKAFFALLYWGGLRRGEAVALLKKDFSNGHVNVYKTMKHYKNGFNKTKTASSTRTIKLDSSTVELLEPLLKVPGQFLFGGEYSLPISTIDNHFRRATAASGVKKIRLHDLRHSHATNLINGGANIVAVSKRLGHATVSMTLDVYTHLLQKSEDELITLIGDLNTSVAPSVAPFSQKQSEINTGGER